MENREERGRVKVPIQVLLLFPVTALLLVPILGLWGLGALQTRLETLHQANLQIVASSLATIIEDSPLLIDQLVFTSSGLPERDLAVERQSQQIVLDGFDDEWAADPLTLGASDLLESSQPYRRESFGVTIRAAADDTYLYLFYKITDDLLVYRRMGEPSIHRNDHIRLALLTPNGVFSRFTIANLQPGPVTAHVIAAAGRSLRHAAEIKGQWVATPGGYQVEVAIPRGLVGQRFSTSVADVDDGNERRIAYVMGRNPTERETELGRILFPSDSLQDLVAALPFSAAAITDDSGRVLAQLTNGPVGSDPGWLSPRTISTKVPVNYYGRSVGFVRIDDDTRHIVSMASQTLSSLLAPGLGLIALGILLAGLAYRILIGRFEAMSKGLQSGDERPLGRPRDRLSILEREYLDTLAQTRQYNGYLETVASRLSHELRTPVSIVRSSLENLNQKDLSSDQTVYIDRAQDGLRRLTSILNKMSEARRIEESLDEDEVTTFNLDEVLRGCIEGYRLAYPNHRFETNIQASQVTITGIADLIAQLLDKLIDNAVAFDDGQQPICLGLSVAANEAILRVSNTGPGLPDQMQDRLLDSMVTVRADSDIEHHLGLGLYIARIIARFHGGSLSLRNADSGEGVHAEFRVPILRITAKLR